MALSFAFNPETETPESTARRRALADLLSNRIGGAQNWGQGVGDMLRGLAAGVQNSRANRAETAGRGGANKLWDSKLSWLFPTADSPPIGAASGVTPSNAATPSTQDGSTGTWLAQQLSKDFGLSPGAAAGFAGNLAHESGNFKHLQEIKPMVDGSRGGFGWAQWTGPRRKAFESWASSNGLDPTSREANYGFLKHELQNTPEGAVLARLKGVTDPAQAANIVSNTYLRPGYPHVDSRVRFANQIAASMGGENQPAQVASADPSFMPAAATPQAPQMAAQPVSQQMAQAQPAMQGAAPQGGGNERLMQLYQLMSNPWLDDSKKAIVGNLIEQEMKKADPMNALQLQLAQQNLQKGAIDIQQTQNPDKVPLTPLQQLQAEQLRIQNSQLLHPVAKPQEPYTLNPGDVRFGADNKPVANVPDNQQPKPPTVDLFYDEGTGQPYKAQWNPKTQTWDRVGGHKGDENGITITNPDGTTTQIGGSGGRKLTEADRRAELLAKQIVAQEADLMAGFDSLATVGNSIGSATGVAGRGMMSGQGQVADDALKNVAANWLYLTSGATAPPSEVDRQFQMIKPTALDTPEAKTAKKARLQSMIDTMKARANIQVAPLAPAPPPIKPALRGQPVMPQAPAVPQQQALPPEVADIPPEAIDMLRKNPDSAELFDNAFGPGSAKKVLGK